MGSSHGGYIGETIRVWGLGKSVFKHARDNNLTLATIEPLREGLETPMKRTLKSGPKDQN